MVLESSSSVEGAPPSWLVRIMPERPEAYFLLFTALNFLNFLDRGIIPGATNEFTAFIKDTLNTDTPSLYLGLCQSSFIIGFCVASPVFGHLVHYKGPFTLVAWGMSIWCCAVILSGMAFYTNSYMFLVFARMLSGVGESSLQCAIPPWIAKNASPTSVGKWVSIFYTAIPVGTAVGYAYSASVANSVGWQWGFFIEAFIIAPFIFFLYSAAPLFPLVGEHESHFPIDRNRTLLTNKVDSESHQIELSSGGHTPPNAIDEFLAVVKMPVYDTVCAGYAAQTGALIGISTFGSAFLMGIGFFEGEEEASLTFGAAVSFAGILGTPLGGYLMDKYCTVSTPRTSTDGHHHYNNTKILLLNATSSGLGCILLCVIFFVQDKALYILLITLGATVIFLAMSGANMAVMMAVPPAHRSFAIALCSIIIHTFGDVPSPILTGYIKDKLAPGCIGDDDAVAVSDSCRDDEEGLRTTMLIVSTWIWWSVIFNFLAAVLSHYKIHSFSLGPKYKPLSTVDTRGLLDLDDENAIGEDEPSVHGNYN